MKNRLLHSLELFLIVPNAEKPQDKDLLLSGFSYFDLQRLWFASWLTCDLSLIHLTLAGLVASSMMGRRRHRVGLGLSLTTGAEASCSVFPGLFWNVPCFPGSADSGLLRATLPDFALILRAT